MRIRRAHHLAPILENLHRGDVGQIAERDRLLDPDVDHALDVGDRHAGQRQIVTRGKAQNAATSRFAFGDKQTIAFHIGRRVSLQRLKIIVEHEGVRVVGIAGAAHAQVARTKIAVGVMGERCRRRFRLALALPGALRAVRRHQDPFAGQRIETAVRGAAKRLYARHGGLLKPGSDARRRTARRRRCPHPGPFRYDSHRSEFATPCRPPTLR